MLPDVVLPSGKKLHLNYLWPQGYDPEQRYPLLIWLHADHQADDWYLGRNADESYLAHYDADGYYNTAAFRAAYPCITVVIYADQTAGGVSAPTALANWGGGTNPPDPATPMIIGSPSVFSGDSGPNTFAVLGVVDWARQTWSIDPSRIYLVGYDIGATGAAYLMLKYNQVNGTPAVFAAAMAIGGAPTIRSGGLTAAQVAIMTEVPVWWVSGAVDTVCPPHLWNEPMWLALAGTSTYPAPGSTAQASAAGASQYHYWEDPAIGHQQVDSSGAAYPQNPILLDWLFGQVGSVTTVRPRLWPTPASVPMSPVLDNPAAAAYRSVRSTTSVATGRVYFEVMADHITEHFTVGLATANYNLAEPMGPGTATKYLVPRPALVDSIGYHPGARFNPCRIYLDDGAYGASGLVSFCVGEGDVDGAVIGVAIDLVTVPGVATIWFSSPAMRAGGYDWNNDVIATQNPLGSVGGISLQHLAAGPYFAVFAAKEAGAVATFNFGSAPFAQSPPDGYLPWDAVASAYVAPVTTVGSPTNLTAAVSTASTVPLQWSPPASGPAPAFYAVQMWSVGQTGNLWRTIGTTDGMSFLVTDLTPASATRFRVNANTSLGAGSWCRDLEFLTQSTDGLTIAPLDLHLLDATAVSMTLYWAPAIGPAPQMTYQFFYAPYRSDQPDWHTLAGFTALPIVAADTVTITLVDLAINQAYWVAAQILLNGVPVTNGLSYNVFTPLAVAPWQGGGETLLIPAGAEQISYSGRPVVLQPVGEMTGFAVYVDANVPAIDPATTAAVLSACPLIYNMLVQAFGSRAAAVPSLETIANPTGQSAIVILGANQISASMRLAPADINFYLSVAAPDTDNADVYNYLLTAQYAGVFLTMMAGFAAQPAIWPENSPFGAALGQCLAFELYPNAVFNGNTINGQVAAYLNGDRADWLTSATVITDAAIGCNILFITYLVHQLGFSYWQIISTINGLSPPVTAASLYAAITTTIDPYPAFISAVNAAFPSVVPTQFTYNPWPVGLG